MLVTTGHHRTPFLKLLSRRLLLAGVLPGSDADREESLEPPLAYALVKVKGKFRSVLQKLKSFPNLVEAHLIHGEFDVVASFNGFSQDELMENSVEKISRINGVTASETLITWTPPANRRIFGVGSMTASSYFSKQEN